MGGGCTNVNTLNRLTESTGAEVTDIETQAPSNKPQNHAATAILANKNNNLSPGERQTEREREREKERER